MYGAVPSGTALAAVSPRLAYVLEAWRKQSAGRRDNVGEIVGADGKTQLLRSMLVDVAKQSTQTTVPRPDDTFAALAAVSAGR